MSDVPKTNTWKPNELRNVTHSELVDAICDLDDLYVIDLRLATWLSRDLAVEIVFRAGGSWGLSRADFRECGMNPKHSRWAKKWTARKPGHSVRDIVIFDQ